MKIVVFLPTYNECHTIIPIIREIRALSKEWHILVVDDHSPDGTAALVRNLQKEDTKIHIIIRKKNKGRGYAGVAAFRRACELDADRIIEMDADGSHSPRFIPALLAAANQSAVVLGSRYVKGGCDDERGWFRRMMSFCSRYYLKIVLLTDIKDPTSGFRCFQKQVFDIISLSLLRARNPFIITELLFWCLKKHIPVYEIPIYFYKRQAGDSKLNCVILIEYLIRVLFLRIGCGIHDVFYREALAGCRNDNQKSV